MWPNPQLSLDLVTFTEKILYGKLHFLCSDINKWVHSKKTNSKINILEILEYKIQPEITKSKIFTRFNFFTKLSLFLQTG